MSSAHWRHRSLREGRPGIGGAGTDVHGVGPGSAAPSLFTWANSPGPSPQGSQSPTSPTTTTAQTPHRVRLWHGPGCSLRRSRRSPGHPGSRRNPAPDRLDRTPSRAHRVTLHPEARIPRPRGGPARRMMTEAKAGKVLGNRRGLVAPARTRLACRHRNPRHGSLRCDARHAPRSASAGYGRGGRSGPASHPARNALDLVAGGRADHDEVAPGFQDQRPAEDHAFGAPVFARDIVPRRGGCPAKPGVRPGHPKARRPRRRR